MKDGLIFENDELIYYKHGKPYHAGAIKVDGDVYYISSKGRAIKGQHAVHREMTNGILERGVYTFGQDYKLVKGSYIPPKKKKRKKNKALSKKQQTRLSVYMCAALLLVVAGFVFVSQLQPRSTHQKPAVTAPGEKIRVSLPDFKEVQLCSNAALGLYNGEYTVQQAVETGEAYRPLEFDYVLTGTDATLFISENENFQNAFQFEMPETKNRVLINNLKTGTKYYWKVIAGKDSYQGDFETVKSTRFVIMNGAENTRDIGGYVTQDGKTVKQGLIIRGTEIDGLAQKQYFVPSESIEDIQNTFGFVYEFDLREDIIYGREYESRLGKDVGHKFYVAPQYGQVFSLEYKDSLKNIFADLANPDNYPMYLHCTYGADRTGTIVFLLQGILNMSEQDMISEYRLTGFHRESYATTDAIDVVIEGLRLYEGDTIQEKILNFLTTEIGVTQSQLDSIRNILLSE